jgi:5'-nucleotidase
MNIPDRPADEIQGMKVARQGQRIYFDEMVSEARQNGLGSVKIRVTREASWVPEEGTDMDAVSKGWISLTPLSLDFTHHEYLRELAERVAGWKNT